MNIEQQLTRDEGRYLTAYQGERDKPGTWTIGIGHKLGESIPPGWVHGISDLQCDALFAADLMHVRQLLDVYCPWWSSLDGIDGPRSNVLVNAGFNLGVAGLATFHRFLHYMEMREWDNAAVDLRMTLVFKQLPARYGRLQTQILTGVFQ